MAVDPNIKKKADDIRNKIYGKEVRESLASGLEAMSTDVVENTGRQDNVESQFQDVIENTTDKDVISAPEIISARNGESNLKARLDKENQEVTKHTVGWINALENGLIDDDIDLDTGVVVNDLFEEYDTVYIPNGTFHIKTTIVIPEEKELIMDKSTLLYAQANVDVVQLSSRSRLVGGHFLNGIGVDFTSSMILIKQDDYTRGATRGQQIKNVELTNTSFTGTGIMLDAENTAISFCEIKDFRIFGFEYGINSNMTPPNTYLTAFIIKGVIEQARITAYLRISASIIELSGQAGRDIETNEHAVTVTGEHNIITSLIYDTGNPGLVKNQLFLSEVSTSNLVNKYFGRVIDFGSSNYLAGGPISNEVALRRTGFIHGVNKGYMLNTLSNAHKRLDCSLVRTNVRTNIENETSLARAITNPIDPDTFAQYTLEDTTNDGEVIITFNLKESVKITEVNANFFTSNYAPDILFIERSTDGTNWVTLTEKHSQDFFTTTGARYPAATNYIRFVMKLKAGSSGIRLTSVSATGQKNHSNYLSTTGARMYGNITFFENGMGTVHVSPNGTKFRLGVTDSGEATFTEV